MRGSVVNFEGVDHESQQSGNRLKMQEGMMSHMMEHMQAGTGSMAMCPMMTPTGGTKRE